MEEIIQILMRRDGLDWGQAYALYSNCQDEINDIIVHGGSLEEVEDVIKDWLGLEPDYVMEFI